MQGAGVGGGGEEVQGSVGLAGLCLLPSGELKAVGGTAEVAEPAVDLLRGGEFGGCGGWFLACAGGERERFVGVGEAVGRTAFRCILPGMLRSGGGLERVPVHAVPHGGEDVHNECVSRAGDGVECGGGFLDEREDSFGWVHGPRGPGKVVQCHR